MKYQIRFYPKNERYNFKESDVVTNKDDSLADHINRLENAGFVIQKIVNITYQ